MTQPDPASLSTRFAAVESKMDALSAKLDALTAKVETRDEQGHQLQRLLDRLDQRNDFFAERFASIESKIDQVYAQSTRDTNGLRLDLERQLRERTDEGNRVHVEIQKDVDSLLDPKTGAFARLNAVDNALSRVNAWMTLIGAIAGAGLTAAVSLMVRAFGS